MINALLNEEGRKVWGYVFPEGEIPVKNVLPFMAKLEGLGEEQVYLVDWVALTEMQRMEIIKHFAEKSMVVSVEEIETEILKKGLPLRAKYVSCTSFPGRLIE